MPETPHADALAAEFDLLMTRAGLTVPQARRASVIAAYADLRGQMALLRDRYSHLHEPANVFRLTVPGAGS
jgi:hypothetical protein